MFVAYNYIQMLFPPTAPVKWPEQCLTNWTTLWTLETRVEVSNYNRTTYVGKFTWRWQYADVTRALVMWMQATTHSWIESISRSTTPWAFKSSPPSDCRSARGFHLVSSVLPSRTSWISLASSVSYISRASARFLCSLAWDFSRALARS